MYATDLVSSVVTPNQELVGFQKVDLAYVLLGPIIVVRCLTSCTSAGSSQTVTISVNSSQLGLWSIDNQWVVEPGKFAIRVGTSDQTFLNTTLTVQ